MSVIGDTGAGASAGSVVGPWGTAIGAGVGFLGGLASDYFGSQAQQAQLQAQLAANAKAQGNISDFLKLANTQYSPYMAAGQQGLNQLENGNFQGNIQSFTPQTNVSAFLNPSINYQAQLAQRGQEQSAAAANGLYSGAQQKALQDRLQNMGQTGWQSAFQNMMGTNTQNIGLWQNQFQQSLANAQQRLTQATNLTNTGANATNSFVNANASATNNLNQLLGQQGTLQGGLNAAPSAMYANMTGQAANAIPNAMSTYNQGVYNQSMINYLQGMGKGGNNGSTNTNYNMPDYTGSNDDSYWNMVGGNNSGNVSTDMPF